MNAYVPILGLMALAALFLAVAIFASVHIGPARYSKSKYDAYECGIEPTPQPTGGGRYPVKYYITAMLFIVFDIEIVFLYPWAVTFNQFGLFAFFEMLMFVATVIIAYVYVVRRGGLTWE